MPTYLWTAAFMAAILTLTLSGRTEARPLAPSNLRCEYLKDPLGIDAPQPRLFWEVNDTSRGAAQTAYQVLVASSRENLKADRGDVWDSGKVASNQSIQVIYSRSPLESGRRYCWKMRTWDASGKPSPWSKTAIWGMGLLDPGAWQAQWIGDPADRDLTSHPEGADLILPPPMLRKGFRLNGQVRQATVYVTALGLYELRINGRRVGDHILAPEWTDYHQRVQYQAYDVARLLCDGENAIGVMMGDGWYSGRIGLTFIVPGGPGRGLYGRKPRLLAQLEIEMADGSRQRVVSDETWRCTSEGPVRSGDILDGEVYDARREMAGWDKPGFDDSGWKPVEVVEVKGVRLVAQPNEPIRIVRQLKPVALTEPRPGVYIFDLGQNMVGWARLMLKGKAGTVVTLHHAEMLNPDGTIYTANLRSAAQTDRYILRGKGQEVFEPHFTYHGFRYVEVTGLEQKPSPDALTGCVIHSSSPDAGKFECSSPMLNKLWENIVWTQRGNLHSTPTDCPQRDERLGWMGDIQAFAQTAIFNMDMAAFFTKWVPDIRDAQAGDGRFPDFAPHPFGFNERFSGAPAWGDAGTVVPWRVYTNYGDTRMLEEHFEAAKRWVEYVKGKNPGLLWREGRDNDYNDWLNGDTLIHKDWPTKGAAVPNEVLATAFFAHSTEVVSRMASALGREEEAKRYASLFEEIKAAFNRAYVDAEGRILGGTQAGYALALNFNLLPDALRPLAARHMVEGIRRYNGHISTGIQTTHRMMLELTRSGYSDVAYQLLNNRTFPSWGYSIDNGATTIWERWDGYVEGRGFQDPGMNSFNHWALGAVGEWMYRVILGIEPDENSPGFSHFTIHPRPGGGLQWAKGEYRSIRGKIAVRWEISDSSFRLEAAVPPNTMATIYVPAKDVSRITESGKPVETAEGVTFIRMEEGTAVFAVGSGIYRFEASR